jgi:hypothetical protein
MHAPLRPVQIVLVLPARDYSAFVEAVRLLRRVMGRSAPDTRTLVTRTLRNRDALGVADDYLDAIAWPMSRRKALRAAPGACGSSIRHSSLARCLRVPSDPSRN